jgi:hypothetical protein
MPRSVESRLEALEASAGADRSAYEAWLEPLREISARNDEEAQRQRERYDIADTAEKIAIREWQIAELDRERAEIEAYMAANPPDGPIPYFVRCIFDGKSRRRLELDLLELKGAVSAEVLCVARWRDEEAIRNGKDFPPLATHAQAVQLIESRQVPDYYLPEHLKRPSPKRQQTEGVTGTVVPSFYSHRAGSAQTSQSKGGHRGSSDGVEEVGALEPHRHNEERGREFTFALERYESYDG